MLGLFWTMSKIHVVTFKAMSVQYRAVFTSLKTFLSKPGKSHHSKRALPQACAHPRMLFLGCPKSFFLFYPFSCRLWKQKHRHMSQHTINTFFFVTIPSWGFKPMTKKNQKSTFLYRNVTLPLGKAMCHEQNITDVCSNICQKGFSY